MEQDFGTFKMSAILHCIIEDIENSRWKDHIRDWNTNMKVDMYDEISRKIGWIFQNRKYIVFGNIFELEHLKSNLNDKMNAEEFEAFREWCHNETSINGMFEDDLTQMYEDFQCSYGRTNRTEDYYTESEDSDESYDTDNY